MGAVLVPFFTEWGHLSLFQIQFLQAWYMFWVFVLEVPTGAIADYWGRKQSITLGSLVSGLGFVIYSQTHDFHVFLFCEMLLATGMALLSGANEAWAYDYLKEHKKEERSREVIGKSRGIYLLGLMFASPVGGWIAARYGLNAPLLWSAIPFLLSAIVSSALPEPRRFTQKSEIPRYVMIIKEGVKYVFQHPSLWKVAFEAIVLSSTGYYVIWLYQPLLIRAGVSIEWFGWFNVILLVMQVLITQNFEFISRWFSVKKYRWLNSVLSFLGFSLVALYPSVTTIIIFLLTAGGFGNSYWAYAVTQMNELVPSEKRATVLSAVSMWRRFTLVIFNPLVGWGADRSLPVTLAFLAVASWLVMVPFIFEKKNS